MLETLHIEQNDNLLNSMTLSGNLTSPRINNCIKKLLQLLFYTIQSHLSQLTGSSSPEIYHISVQILILPTVAETTPHLIRFIAAAYQLAQVFDLLIYFDTFSRKT